MRKTTIVILVIILVFARNTAAQADDYITDAATALKRGNVYVYPSIEGSIDIQGRLQSILGADNIVLVMFPETVATELGKTPDEIAVLLSEKLGNQRIIGLAVGNEVVGYAPTLPIGVASDKMRRADNVSNDAVTALITYAQNIQSWQRTNLAPTVTPIPTVTATPKPERVLTPAEKAAARKVTLIILSVALLLVSLALLYLAGAFRSKEQKLQIRLDSRLASISRYIEQIDDYTVRRNLQVAVRVARGLANSIVGSLVEDAFFVENFPVLLQNMETQIRALIRHETGDRPLDSGTVTRIKRVLTTYDELFTKVSEQSGDVHDLLQSIIDTHATMLERLGITPDE